MRAFGWWLLLVALEVIGCLVLALVSARMGYPDAGAAFVRCAWVIAAIGGASVLLVSTVALWIRARPGAGKTAILPARFPRAAGQHGPIRSRRA